MTWGSLTIGGITFRESWSFDGQDDGLLRLHGQESHPPLAKEAVRAIHDNLVSFPLNDTVPVIFSDKANASGFYRVTDATSSLLSDIGGGPVVSATWTMSIARIGPEQDIEFESRVPTLGRVDELAGTQTPSFWHAPPPGSTSYYTGPTVPAGTVVRPSAEGDVTVFTGLPADIAPRWTVPAASYLLGSARILTDGYRRVGLDTPPEAATGWELNNGIVRVKPSGAGISVEVWDGVTLAWESLKTYIPAVSGTNLTATPEFTILRNEPGEVTARLSYPGMPGRTTIDLSLRRGARFVTGVMKRHSAATMGLRRSTAEASTLQTGGLMSTAVDAAGNRALMISSRLLGTTDVATPYISKAAVTAFDFALGAEVGAAPGSGNAFADLLLQYLGTSGDRTRAVRR